MITLPVILTKEAFFSITLLPPNISPIVFRLSSVPYGTDGGFKIHALPHNGRRKDVTLHCAMLLGLDIETAVGEIIIPNYVDLTQNKLTQLMKETLCPLSSAGLGKSPTN